ncbi:MAG: GIY-YIG nuclease family protein [Paracoccaceae bacterium]|nr:GIY-YIG nuclease family protein [Paracoccaceae bacterium]
MGAAGFVYVMRSPATPLIKIGMSGRAPHFRARELTADPEYGQLGPWSVVDYREVTDMRRLERALHRRFAPFNQPLPGGASELFSVSETVACAALIESAETCLAGAKPVGKLRVHPGLMAYLRRLFRETGLEQFLDLQEMWTLSVFNSTAGGRDFTLNIDRHEVALAAPIRGAEVWRFMIYADRKLSSSWAVRRWLRAHRGSRSFFRSYESARPGGTAILFDATYDDALTFFDLPMMRRALVAYWYDALLNLRDRDKRSFFARFHNHNAVAEIIHVP